MFVATNVPKFPYRAFTIAMCVIRLTYLPPLFDEKGIYAVVFAIPFNSVRNGLSW